MKKIAAKEALKKIEEGCDVVDALRERKIDVKVEGSGIESVQAHIRRRVPYELTVHIPVGTYFVSGKASVQNMVTTEKSEVELTTDEWESVSVSAACANMRLAIPGSGDSFTVQRSPKRAELVRLMPVLERGKVDWATKQAAVWIVTDNADYDDLGILVSGPFGIGGSRVINEQEAARAMQLCDEAGIDITRKAIWKDRQQIISGLKDDTLKRWLMERK